MTALVLSTVVLGCGPLMGWVLRGSALGLQLLDGFVLAAILGLCGGHLVPHALEAAGPWALVALALGFLLPSWLERRMERLHASSHAPMLILIALGLAAHSAFDGAALAGAGAALDHAGGAAPQGLGLAMVAGIVLHRLPVGLLLWWTIRPVHGRRGALAALALVAASTVAGYALLGATFHQHLEGPFAGYLVAMVAGTILHVVLHQTHPEGFSERTHACPRYAGAGALLAAGLLWWAPGATEAHAHGGAAEAFVRLVLESAPALLLGFTAAGLVQTFLPEAGVEWLRRGNVATQSLKGMAFGLPLPICSCGVVPVYEGLARKGAPMAAGVAFLVATPELGLDALLLSIPLLGAELAAVRLAAAVGVAMVVGMSLGLAFGDRPPPEDPDAGCGGGGCCGPDEPQGLGARVQGALRYGFVEMVDHTGPWIFVGLAAAALLEPHLDLTGLAAWPGSLQVVAMALLGMPLYVCATGATPIAAMLLAKGVAPGGVLAFLLAGPATNLTTFGVLRGLHGRAVASAFVAAMLAACVAAGLATEALVSPSLAAAAAEHEHHAAAWWQVASAWALGAAAVASLLRQGPRGLLRQVLAVEPHDHGHDHEAEAGGEAAPPDPHDGHHGHACAEARPLIAHDHGCEHDHGCD